MNQRLSFLEKAGYSCGDAAANFVFMTMVLFQLNFYTDVFGLSANTAAAILLWPRLWDAIFDPVMGVLADRTSTRWGKFRPWVLWTTIPWCVVMVAAYTTPDPSWGWSTGMVIAYAGITNTLLMTLYSMNNMPYSALGGVMTGDLNERTKLNSYRFVSVNVAQFIVGGFTLPLVAKFAQGHDRAHGWQVTMTIWAALCLVLFLVTVFTTKERIKPIVETHSSPRQDFADLLKNAPWIALVAYTVFNFGMLSLRGGAHYSFYHHYVDKAAMFDFVAALGLTTPDPAGTGGLADTLGYIVHGTRDSLAQSNVADVYNSILNMAGFGTTIVVIMLTSGLSARFGKRTVAIAGFALASLQACALYLMPPTAVWGMLFLHMLGSVFYAPTIAVMWAMYADAADYSEWQTGRRFTGMVFATIGFSLKSGLALGSAGLLWCLAGFFGYDTQHPTAPNAIEGYRVMSSFGVGALFAACTICMLANKLNKRTTLKMADDLAQRRLQAGLAPAAA
ncbi:MFS transporter [Pelomonas aquatica]|jgi:GPH family glycoside/pentoside/hexuronide:cation symporter|uniref:MFS transporter n=1 Tax=Pelomonas aquatica TaxID=431058 RepID=A0A9X4LR54_9BURK|nr:MFS transporter [Pelomonas aquatica]MCY4756267.1 MFS transporter [Pelomonas aquatica]MDG0864983.1 MFS transporter [Pelomonas aquatica]